MTDGVEPGVTGQQLRNVRLLVAYDGTDFRGFAESDGVRTDEGELRGAIERVVRRPVELVLGGRTDAGVHGWGQVVNGRLPVETDLYRLMSSINQLLRPEISVRDPAWVDDAFSARFSATSRTYRYDIWNDRSPNPLVARHAWHIGPAVNIEPMNMAAGFLLGNHDFSSFCRKPKPGLLMQIAQHFGLPLQGVAVVGDSERDLQAAVAVGARPILVRTGNGKLTEQRLAAERGDIEVYDDLASAVATLIKE